MKKVIIILCCLLAVFSSSAQGTKDESLSALPTVYLNRNITVHFTSPVEIKYADISSGSIVGDLPLKNVFRIKAVDSIFSQHSSAVLTIITENSISQFKLILDEDLSDSGIKTNIEMTADLMQPFGFSGIELSSVELRQLSLGIIKNKPAKNHKTASQFGIVGNLSGLYTLDDYIFLDLSYLNSSNIRYDVEGVSFSLEDKKINSASNNQSVILKPEFTLFKAEPFKHQYRNVFVFRKFNYPGSKVFRIRLSEKQISGRVVSFDIKYSKLLDADILIAK